MIKNRNISGHRIVTAEEAKKFDEQNFAKVAASIKANESAEEKPSTKIEKPSQSGPKKPVEATVSVPPPTVTIPPTTK
jgi:hypothetical protein